VHDIDPIRIAIGRYRIPLSDPPPLPKQHLDAMLWADADLLLGHSLGPPSYRAVAGRILCPTEAPERTPRRAAEALTTEGAVLAGRPNPWLTVAEKCDGALVALSMRLRISPQARMRPETTKAKHPGSVYDLMRAGNAEE
jgi:hypothetical protein